MQFRVLGPLRVVGAGAELPIGPPKQRTLLALLLSNANEVVSVDRIVDALWATPPKSAASVVQVYVSGLRKVLGHDVLATKRPGYVLVANDDEIDAERFARAVVRARSLDAPRAAQELEAALGLWEGPAYDDVAFEEFAQPEIRRLTELRSQAEERLNEARLEMGDADTVLAAVSAQLEERPLSEALWRQQMLALYRSGRQPDALKAYQRACLAFAEIGTEPSSDLSELERRILVRDPRLDGRSTREETRTNLPTPVSSFIGRDGEIAEVLDAVDEHRLVSLVGPGGIGKTRLAAEVARRLLGADWHGVWSVELAAAVPGDRLSTRILVAIGESDSSRDASDVDALVAYLRSHRTVLVLDNCDHLVPDISNAVHQLLVSVPDLRVLATSRCPLGVDGEQVVRVPTLEIDADDLVGAPSEAERLFMDRAVLADSTIGRRGLPPEPLDAVVRSTGGIPLAIELAASRLGTMPIEDLARHIRQGADVLVRVGGGASDRHGAMSSTLDWSHRALSEQGRRHFRRLSVFRGGFTLAIADCYLRRFEDGESPDGCAIDLVGELITASLVVPIGTDRYVLLEPIRQYAAKLLGDAGEREAALRWHAVEYREAVDVPDWVLFHPHRAVSEAEGAIAREIDNLDAATVWWAGHDPAAAEHITSLAGSYLCDVRRTKEALRWYERVLDVPTEPSPARARCLTGACFAALYAEGTATAQQYVAELVRVAEAMDDDRWRAAAASREADLAAVRGDEELAYRLTLVAADRLEACDHPELGAVLNNRTSSLLVSGRVDEAEVLGRRFSAAAALSDDVWAQLAADAYLSLAAAYRGNASQAQERLGSFEGRGLYGDDEAGVWVTDANVARAHIALLRDDYQGAAQHVWPLLEGWDEGPDPHTTMEALSVLGLAALAEGEREMAMRYQLEALAQVERLGHRWLVHEPLTGLAAAILADRPTTGMRVIGALEAESARERRQIRAASAAALRREQTRVSQRSDLRALEDARRDGAGMPLHDAEALCVDEAREVLFGSSAVRSPAPA